VHVIPLTHFDAWYVPWSAFTAAVVTGWRIGNSRIGQQIFSDRFEVMCIFKSFNFMQSMGRNIFLDLKVDTDISEYHTDYFSRF
jgi:hypothetical protein